MKKLLNVVVLAGGVTPEHDISLQSGMNIVRYLDSRKYRIFPSIITKNGKWKIAISPLSAEEQRDFEFNQFWTGNREYNDLSIGEYLDTLEKIKTDIVFIMMHGPFGEDGKPQGMLELAGIPYTGPGATACAASMDKIISKLVIEQLGLKTPPYMIIHKNDWSKDKAVITQQIISTLGGQVFIKAPDLGSSYGLGLAESEDEIIRLADDIFRNTSRLLVEKYIKGIELTVPILGNSSDAGAEALPVIMIVPKKTRFFDLEAKYDNSITDEIVPAPIDDMIAEKAQKEALLIYYALACDGLARIDLIWADNDAYFLEVNPIPGFTSASLYPKAASAAGIEYPELLDRLIQLGLKK